MNCAEDAETSQNPSLMIFQNPGFQKLNILEGQKAQMENTSEIRRTQR